MKFNNLECNILYIFGKERRYSGVLKSIERNQVYKEFSDIPKEDITAAIMSLTNDGLLDPFKDRMKLYLTRKGIAKVGSLKNCIDELN
jgi:hypothetical protein